MAVISGDGVFSHACLGASDLAQSTAFYDAALRPLGVANLGPFGDNIVLYGKDKPALLILTPGNGEAPSSNGVTVGFAASSQADVDAFHKAGLAAGGVDEGAPGPRGHLPNARSEEHTSELQSLMRISYTVFCLKKKKKTTDNKD